MAVSASVDSSPLRFTQALLPLPEMSTGLAMSGVKSTSPMAVIFAMGAVQVGITPQELEFPRGSERIELTFKKAGYQDGTATFFPTQDDQLHAELQKAKPERGGKIKKPRGQKGDGSKTTKETGDTKPPGDPTGGQLKPSPFKKP